MNINPIFLKDFYKVGHIDQYPKCTNLVFSNFTPRKSRIPGVNHSVFFGLQYFIKKYLNSFFNPFIIINSEKARIKYHDIMVETLGVSDNQSYKHIKKLFDLSYLPIAIHALPEGTEVPCGCPALVIYNTDPDFYWLPNMLETILSCTLWGACTSATMANEYRKLLDQYASDTSDIPEFVDYQAHDFSMRGMFGLEAACISGMAHLQYFKGTDTIPALLFNHNYYDKPLHIASVPATEHSVMSAGSKVGEFDTFKRLITEIYPSGILSIVSDTWDLWKVVDEYLPSLKNEIMSRDGKIVIRPDSGDPIEILCGKEFKSFDDMDDALRWAEHDMSDQASNDCEGSYNCGNDEYSRVFKVLDKYYEVKMNFEYGRHDKKYYFIDEYELLEPIEITPSNIDKGLIECLWDIFNGTINSKGYKQLDHHIGAIYGDSITLDRAKSICERLKDNGFASTNIVFGIGSYTYQYNTRDTLGWAMKATYCEINSEGRAITKDPITDDGTKKSHSGLLKVIKDSAGHFQLLQNQTWDEFNADNNQLKLIYKNGINYL